MAVTKHDGIPMASGKAYPRVPKMDIENMASFTDLEKRRKMHENPFFNSTAVILKDCDVRDILQYERVNYQHAGSVAGHNPRTKLRPRHLACLNQLLHSTLYTCPAEEADDVDLCRPLTRTPNTSMTFLDDALTTSLTGSDTNGHTLGGATTPSCSTGATSEVSLPEFLSSSGSVSDNTEAHTKYDSLEGPSTHPSLRADHRNSPEAVL